MDRHGRVTITGFTERMRPAQAGNMLGHAIAGAGSAERKLA